MVQTGLFLDLEPVVSLACVWVYGLTRKNRLQCGGSGRSREHSKEDGKGEATIGSDGSAEYSTAAQKQ